MTKVCKICRETKPINEFFGNRGFKDGHLAICKNCHKKKPWYNCPKRKKLWCKHHKENNIGKVREKTRLWAKKWRKENPELAKEKSKQYRNVNRQKIMNKVNWAVKSGRIRKPKYCSCCGQEKKVNGHHPDYTQPLRVIWLCSACHKFLHTQLDDCKLYLAKMEEQIKILQAELGAIREGL